MRSPTRIGRPRRQGRTPWIVAGAVVLALIVTGALASFYTDVLWFRETRSGAVLWTRIWTQVSLAAVFGIVFAVVLLINLVIAQKITAPSRLFTMQDQVLERYRASMQPYVKRIIVGGSLLLGLFAGSGATAQWKDWLLYRHAQTFGQLDPVLHKDLGFYVFKLPFLRFTFAWAFSSLLGIAVIVALVHYFLGGIRTSAVGERISPHVKAHLSVLFGLMALLKAWGYRLDQYDLLDSPRGVVTGASYTDVHAQLPALRLLVIIAIVVAALFLVNIRFRGWILPAAAAGLLFLTSIVVGGVYPAAVQRLRVAPVERDKEAAYIQRNIAATREAFNIDEKSVTVKTQPADVTLTRTELKNNAPTVDNIRLWSPAVLVDTFLQLQRITNYYEFLDVDVDRYDIDGVRRQVMISPREVFPEGLIPGARTWVNTHLVYTHGFGVVASRVDRVNAEGQPDFIIQDIPATSVEGAPKITEPRIYFGESDQPQFVVVRSALKELDYPIGETSFQSSQYDGRGGVQLSSLLRRLSFAWRFRDVNILLSSAIKGDSRVMFRREIKTRVKQVAPFIQLDADPYIAIVEGRLQWVLDGYTTTANYPYSQRINLGEITGGDLSGTANYIRNSVKATVDAKDGTITLYVWDETDPIIRAWAEIFPGMLKSRSEMSKDLLAHVRYPENLFEVQADRYALYHITKPIDFYTKNDVWRIPTDPTSKPGAPTLMPPYYVLMKLPGDAQAQFILMVPYSPISTDANNPRQNMTAWLAARSDPEQYGKLESYVFGKEKIVFGPEQIQARINQDPIVRNQLTLLDPRNERIIYGNLLVIPIGKSVMYVQPLYLSSAASKFPELKRVVLVTGSKIRIGSTLAEALAGLFTEAPEPVPIPGGPVSTDVAELIRQAVQHYDLAQQALRNGDFATYGAEIAKMRAALDEAQKASSPSPTPSPSPGTS